MYETRKEANKYIMNSYLRKRPEPNEQVTDCTAR